MKVINGGVAAPNGFLAAGTASGLKKEGIKDLAIIYSEDTAVAAGVFTSNLIKGHSLQLTMEHIKKGYANAIIINSGNANACVGEQGYKDASEIAYRVSDLLDCQPVNILVGSTGVIGIPLDMNIIIPAVGELVSHMGKEGGRDAAEAIMTTDLIPKEIVVEFEIDGEKAVIGAMAKGSGMIHPDMATMIGIITTDADISPGMLDKALKETVNKTFNRISVDGETSVCDMVLILANGRAKNTPIVIEDKNYIKFKESLEYVCRYLSRLIAKDGEGATKLIEVIVEGASREEDAYKAACAISKSPLVKTAMFGEDANWGRIITALGYSGAVFEPDSVDIYIDKLIVCKNGTAVMFDETEAKKILEAKEIQIRVDLKVGKYRDKIWTCDFSYDYIKINGSYRS